MTQKKINTAAHYNAWSLFYPVASLVKDLLSVGADGAHGAARYSGSLLRPASRGSCWAAEERQGKPGHHLPLRYRAAGFAAGQVGEADEAEATVAAEPPRPGRGRRRRRPRTRRRGAPQPARPAAGAEPGGRGGREGGTVRREGTGPWRRDHGDRH